MSLFIARGPLRRFCTVRESVRCNAGGVPSEYVKLQMWHGVLSRSIIVILNIAHAQ